MSEQITSEQTALSPEPSTQTPLAPAAPVKSGGKGLAWLALLVSLLAIGGSGYQFYLTQIVKQSDALNLVTGVNQIGSDVKVLAERINQLQREQQTFAQNTVSKETLQTNLLQASNQNDLALRDIKQAQRNVDDTLKKLAANAERGADKLALDEVSQLLKLANNSAVFSRDRVSAINALKLADSQLQQLADPRYAVVRRSINAEITELEAIASVDISRVTAQLGAAAKRVPGLPLENEPPVVGQLSVAEPAEAQEISFSDEMSKLWVMVVNTVKIKRIDQPPKPLLAPEQRYFLDQNIQLRLATAELAVMQNQAEVYKRNVNSALEWLLDYYDPRDSEVKAVVAELRELVEQPMAPELPSIAGSYDQLQRIKGGN